VGLRKAIADRINAVKSGQAFDSDGTTDTDRVDNVTIQTYKGKRGKRKGVTID
jgi:hypothetical protein